MVTSRLHEINWIFLLLLIIVALIACGGEDDDSDGDSDGLPEDEQSEHAQECKDMSDRMGECGYSISNQSIDQLNSQCASNWTGLHRCLSTCQIKNKDKTCSNLYACIWVCGGGDSRESLCSTLMKYTYNECWSGHGYVGPDGELTKQEAKEYCMEDFDPGFFCAWFCYGAGQGGRTCQNAWNCLIDSDC